MYVSRRPALGHLHGCGRGGPCATDRNVSQSTTSLNFKPVWRHDWLRALLDQGPRVSTQTGGLSLKQTQDPTHGHQAHGGLSFQARAHGLREWRGGGEAGPRSAPRPEKESQASSLETWLNADLRYGSGAVGGTVETRDPVATFEEENTKQTFGGGDSIGPWPRRPLWWRASRLDADSRRTHITGRCY